MTDAPTSERLAPEDVRALVDWFRREARDLPWRRTDDPYRILIAELMLQQTQVTTVLPYYERWMARFPTFRALAEAEEAEVLRFWSGLGYYARARHAHALAREVVARYDGRLPDDPEALRRLPGIGAYTAGAVLSIAFGRPEPAIDGNVRRVLARFFAWETPVDRPAFDRAAEATLRPAYGALRPPATPRTLTEALMELGALVCTPKAPACGRCPLKTHCAARALGRPEAFPVRRPPAPKRREHRIVWIVRRRDGALRVERRKGRLLGGLWQFPNAPFARPPSAGDDIERPVPTDAGQTAGAAGASFAAEALPPDALGRAQTVGTVEHVFTHRLWTLDVRTVAAEAWPLSPEAQEARWLPEEEVAALPLAGPFRKAYELYRARAFPDRA
ncbi:A/G-specific adenine glycosylase [Hydrogenibacillus sp. N12]|uniref:A/G-specific adenine glycosylase n=1 Tax=Hydrogenibacillus sp. N12 TaxID=2866627 RepID=UPI001C7E017B|nr:A/G-specific adenine glycosylase [Hydrogenibacillus sp. N12]QZA33366.1 A/G-specific adenine glycosylase [Hydrogenibacillus sp. N12]